MIKGILQKAVCQREYSRFKRIPKIFVPIIFGGATVALVVGTVKGDVIPPPSPQVTQCTGGNSVTGYLTPGGVLSCGTALNTGAINSGGPQAIAIYPGAAAGTTVGAGTMASYFVLSGGALSLANVPGSVLASGAVSASLGYVPLNPANNLSDVAAAPTAWTNLGGGSLGKLAVPAAGLVNSSGAAVAPITIGTGLAISGTYPNQTLASTVAVPTIPNSPLVSGNGSAYGSMAVGGGLQVSGTFPNQTLAATAVSTPPGGSAGQIQYNNAGVFGGLTNAQLTSNVNLFSASTAGTVAASGGGTTSFLRADGSWVAPPQGGGGSPPGGSSGQVQINNAGAFGGLTNAQLTADINLFSSTLAGATPLSGGGTLNYLRADGAWSVPPGSPPGGVSGQIQYNNGGSFGGLTNTQLTGNINLFSNTTAGATPASGGGTTNFLRADGTWQSPPNALPGGLSGQVQFNNAGVFSGLTNTQLTADINTFSPTLSGAVPLSGGGTTNFLRADGSWVAPPQGGTPGGTNGQIQYNNGGVFGGLSTGMTGVNVVLQSDAGGNAKAPLNTTTATLSGALSVGGAITATGLSAGAVTQWIGLNASNQFVLGTPAGGGGGTVNSCATANALAYYATAPGTTVSCLAGVGTAGQILTSNGAGVAPSFQAPVGGLSNQTAGLIPVASSATTANGSTNPPLAYGATGNLVLVQNDATGHINPAVIPNTTVIGGTYDQAHIVVGADGRITAASTSTTTLSPGLTSNASVYNTGTQTLAGNATLSTQLFYTAVSSAGAYTVQSTDGAKLLTATVAGVTFNLPAPGTIGTSSFVFGYAGNPYALHTAGGTIYGCGTTGATVSGIAGAAQVLTDGTNWMCIASIASGGTIGGSGTTGAIPVFTGATAIGNSEITNTGGTGGLVAGAATGGQKGNGTWNMQGCYVNGVVCGGGGVTGAIASNGSGTFSQAASANLSDTANIALLSGAQTFSGAKTFGEVHGATESVTLTSNIYTATAADCGKIKLLPTGTTPSVTLPNINASCTITFITTVAKSYLFNVASGGAKQNSQGFYNSRGTAAGDTVSVTVTVPSATAATWNISGDVTS